MSKKSNNFSTVTLTIQKRIKYNNGKDFDNKLNSIIKELENKGYTVDVTDTNDDE